MILKIEKVSIMRLYLKKLEERMISKKNYIDLHTRKSNKHINLQDDGVVISEHLATSMNVKIGDTFTFEDSKGNTHKVKVSGICILS